MKATFCNPNFLTEVRKSSSPVIMRTNAGHRRIELEGDMPGFGTCHCDPNFIANTLGFDHLAEKYRVTFDNGPDLKKRVFYVYTENGVVEFKRVSNRLYGGFCPSKDFVNAVAEQKNVLPPPPPTPPTSDDGSSYYSTTDDESECDDRPPPSLANHNLQECDSSSDDSSDDKDSYSPPIARKRNKSGNGNNNSKVTTSDAASKMLAGGSFTQNHVLQLWKRTRSSTLSVRSTTRKGQGNCIMLLVCPTQRSANTYYDKI